MRNHTAIIVVAIVWNLGLGPAAAKEPTGPAVDPLEEAWAALEASDAAIASIQARIAKSPGPFPEVQQRRLEEARIERLETTISFATAVSEYAGRREEVSRHRDAAIARLEGLPTEARRARRELADAFPDPGEGAPAAEQAAATARLAAVATRIDRIFGASVEGLALAKGFDLDVAQQEAWLKQQLVERAETISDLLDIAVEESALLARQASVLPDDAEIAGLRAVADDRVESVATALESSVSMLKQLEVDTASYERQLIAVTGEVKTVDTEVIGGLLKSWSARMREAIAEGGPRLLLSLLLFAVIVFAFWKLARIAQRIVDRALAAPSVQLSHLLKRMISSTARNAVLVVGLLIALSQLGISLGPLLAGLGIAGFIVGFALQDVLSNFASGLFILFHRPFDVEDMVEVSGCFGKVSRMSLVSTTLLTLDNKTLVIPNNKIWGDVITNYTNEDVRRVDLMFGISYGDDIEKAQKILAQVVAEQERTLDDPEPLIVVHELGDSSVNLKCCAWVRTADYWDVFWDLTKQVKLRFDAEGVSIPFPQRDVHFYPDRTPPSAA